MARFSFDGKRVFITGAARGIGFAMATHACARRAQVVVADVDEEAAKEAAAKVNAGGKGRALGVALDVTDAAAYEDVYARVENDEGEIDVAIHNAGVATVGFVETLPLEEWRRVIDVNLFGVVHGVHVAYPRMAARGRGHIVNVASLAGLIPFPSGAPYAASKHAVVGLSESLRAEARAVGVGVTCACPGYIGTDIFTSSHYVGVKSERLLKMVPISPMAPGACAAKILNAAQKDRGLVVVQAEAKLSALSRRFFPRLYAWGTGVAAGQMRQRATLNDNEVQKAIES